MDIIRNHIMVCTGTGCSSSKSPLIIEEFKKELKAAMETRVKAVEGFANDKEGYDRLPDEALEALNKLVDAL